MKLLILFCGCFVLSSDSGFDKVIRFLSQLNLGAATEIIKVLIRELE